MKKSMRVGLFGTGHFGYALLHHLEPRIQPRSSGGIELRGYDADATVRETLQRERRHPFDHAGSPLSKQVRIVDTVAELIGDLDVLVLAVPSLATREVAAAIASQPWTRPLTIVNTAKALDAASGKRLSEIVLATIKRPPRPMTYAVLSGGTIAGELLQHNPLGVTIASRSRAAQRRLKGLFGSPRMWVQLSSDVAGVELAGAFKNVVSICAGLVHGLKLSYGAETLLISRMAQEIEDFCVRCEGARRSTFRMGSQCWGSDLWMSCTGPTRNRALGELIGRGQSLTEAHQVMQQRHQTVEGVATLRALGRLLRKHPRELPLVRRADEVILHGAPPQRLIEALMVNA